MSGALKTVATIAGVVALGATGIGAALGGTLVFTGTAVSVASVATVVSAAASVGAQLTAKEPPRLGSLTDTILAVNPPQPYLLGRTYFGGVIRHETGYGPTTNDVPNPLYFRAAVFSGGGPLQELESVQVDYRPVSFNGANAEGYYKDYLVVDTQLGLCPEPSALAQNFANAVPQWGSSAKLSGQAAIAYIAVFDKEGDRYASGLPALGAVWKGARCYDMRKDGTLQERIFKEDKIEILIETVNPSPLILEPWQEQKRIEEGRPAVFDLAQLDLSARVHIDLPISKFVFNESVLLYFFDTLNNNVMHLDKYTNDFEKSFVSQADSIEKKAYIPEYDPTKHDKKLTEVKVKAACVSLEFRDD